jgi:aminoglycoside phosphotransferase (APT) family kinase protein
VQPIGPKIAEGRDSEIYEHGPGLVLRVPFDGRSLEREGEVMRYVHEHGYPVPKVHDAGDGYLVMDRIDGPTMLDDAIPLRIGRNAKLLAGLHEQLHRIPAPDWDWLPVAPLPGDTMVHRDLHPLNVLITSSGPVVIDWANAGRGDPAYDVADTWVLFATADASDLPAVQRRLAPIARKIFLRHFLGALDRDAAIRAIPAAVEARTRDRNMKPVEIERMRNLAKWASSLTAP